jgi:hypothetical protein
MSDTTQQATTTAAEASSAVTATSTASDEVAALKAQLAALQAAEAERVAAATKAAEEAAAKAEAERQSRMTAEQKRDEELAAQRREIEATKSQLVQERRNLALDKLGVADKFRQFAPSADPADPKGAKQLEDWAKANPELLRPQTVSSSDPLAQLKQKAGTALQRVLSGEKKSTLVTQRNLSKLT